MGAVYCAKAGRSVSFFIAKDVAVAWAVEEGVREGEALKLAFDRIDKRNVSGGFPASTESPDSVEAIREDDDALRARKMVGVGRERITGHPDGEKLSSVISAIT